MKTEKRIWTACLLALLLPLGGCNFFGIPDYELSVTVEPGVTGTPASGLYVHADLEQVSYKYTPVNSQHTVEVLLDDGQESAEATITMYRSMTLVARLIDVRGAWNVTSKDTSSNTTTFTLTLSGPDLLGGTFSDSRGYSGTWTGKNNVLLITYSNWAAYVYTGSLFSMNGTWANGTAIGSWEAARAE